jgi:hypothetical protein
MALAPTHNQPESRSIFAFSKSDGFIRSRDGFFHVKSMEVDFVRRTGLTVQIASAAGKRNYGGWHTLLFSESANSSAK